MDDPLKLKGRGEGGMSGIPHVDVSISSLWRENVILQLKGLWFIMLMPSLPLCIALGKTFHIASVSSSGNNDNAFSLSSQVIWEGLIA